MGFWSGTGKVFTSIFNIRVDKWINYEGLKYSFRTYLGIIKPKFIIAKAAQKETFEEAIQRLNLIENDIQVHINNFNNLFISNLLLAIVVFIYSLYLLFTGSWGGGVMTLCVSLYPTSLAFRFHFWGYQLKKRRLGCTLEEWWNNK